jgi:hypothetical protein
MSVVIVTFTIANRLHSNYLIAPERVKMRIEYYP